MEQIRELAKALNRSLKRRYAYSNQNDCRCMALGVYRPTLQVAHSCIKELVVLLSQDVSSS